jgi:hypothetical protein
MNTKGIGHAIAAIEKELENLKSHAGLPMDTGEEDSYEEETAEPETKQVGRGRKKRTVPTMGEMEQD